MSSEQIPACLWCLSIRAAGSPQSCLVFKATGQAEEKIWVGTISIMALLQMMLFFLCEIQMLFLLLLLSGSCREELGDVAIQNCV